MSQVQPQAQTQPQLNWKQGAKPYVSFTTLPQLQHYEPEVYKLFKQIKDGEKVETEKYTYKLKDSGSRWGISVQRFIKQQPQQPQQQTQEQKTNTSVNNNNIIDSGASIRNELRAVEVVARNENTKELVSLYEIRKQVNTILAALDLLIARHENKQ